MRYKVFSAFNGMSCGLMALDELGIKCDYYYSEIDKYANKLTSSLYPNAIPLGDIRNIDASKLPEIDIFLGGFPCTDFSIAGKMRGMITNTNIEITTLEQYIELKQQGFEFEGQSYLFWELIRIFREVNPKYFLFENVVMSERWRKIITQNIGIKPIRINASLLSAQSRDRNYWTNISAESQGLFGDLVCTIPLPKDEGLLLKDILESDVDEKYYLSDKLVSYLHTRKDNFNNGKINYKSKKDKASCINANSGKLDISDNIIIQSDIICHNIQTKVKVRKHEVDVEGLKSLLKSHKTIPIKEIAEKLNIEKTKVEHWFRQDTYFAIPDAEYWDELKQILNIKTNKFDLSITEFIEKDNVFDQSNRAFGVEGKNPTLLSSTNPNLIIQSGDYRGDEGFRWRDDNKTPTLLARAREDKYGCPMIKIEEKKDDIFPADYRSDEGIRIRENGKAPTLTKGSDNSGTQYNSLVVIKKHHQKDNINDVDSKAGCLVVGSHMNSSHFTKTQIGTKIRRLTPRECARLQTVPERVIDKIVSIGISDSQLYKMLGNGWCVNVIIYILSFLPKKIIQ